MGRRKRIHLTLAQPSTVTSNLEIEEVTASTVLFGARRRFGVESSTHPTMRREGCRRRQSDALCPMGLRRLQPVGMTSEAGTQQHRSVNQIQLAPQPSTTKIDGDRPVPLKECRLCSLGWSNGPLVAAGSINRVAQSAVARLLTRARSSSGVEDVGPERCVHVEPQVPE